VRCLVAARHVVDDFRSLLALLDLLALRHRAFAVITPHVEVGVGTLLVVVDGLSALALFLLRIRELDDLLGAQANHVELNAREELAVVLVVLELLAFAIELEELRNVASHVIEAGGTRGFGTGAEHVPLEVEVRGVDARVVVRVVQGHVAERDRGFAPVLRLEVGTRASVLHFDILLLGLFVALGRLDVANVAIEGLHHALLHGREVFGLELLPLALLAGLPVLFVAGRSEALTLAVGLALVHLIVHFLVAEHRGIGGFAAYPSILVTTESNAGPHSSQRCWK
jgi:hypothetical protein